MMTAKSACLTILSVPLVPLDPVEVLDVAAAAPVLEDPPAPALAPLVGVADALPPAALEPALAPDELPDIDAID